MEPVTIGICAYNEERNIGDSIESAFAQEQKSFRIEEVVVVSSGSTDATDDIVRGLAGKYPNLKLLVEEERRGKNSAINLLLDSKSTEIVVLLNADNVLGDADTLERLVSKLLVVSDPPVGIVGGRPMPTNDPGTLIGFSTQMLWTMHHEVAVAYPKIGELVAFRDVGTRLPLDSQSDEDILRMRLEEKGYVGAYVEDAVVRNRGPETVADFLKQRTRVNVGEVYMKRIHGYGIPTWDRRLLFNALLGTVRELGIHPFRMAFTIVLELVSRLRAMEHVRRNRGDLSVWDQVGSTKKL